MGMAGCIYIFLVRATAETRAWAQSSIVDSRAQILLSQHTAIHSVLYLIA
jgi:hypothetical protein